MTIYLVLKATLLTFSLGLDNSLVLVLLLQFPGPGFDPPPPPRLHSLHFSHDHK